MKGDFSRWNVLGEKNFNGVLHQQGRVLTDADWNDQTRLNIDWQDRAARHVIGARVMAIPAEEPNAFKIVSARVDGGEVKLDVYPGHGWADGVAAQLAGDPASILMRVASYLGSPIQDPMGDSASIADGVRDAVVLEVWRQALNAFQTAQDFFEPALGGPDTTERIHTAMRFRLYRLDTGDVCQNLFDKLQDDFSTKGKLKVTLKPSTSTTGPCPVVEGGGYLGFEHFLYRIEIAEVNAAQIMFKWSKFNAGIVGRGECDLGAATKKITIKANDQAIKMSGLTDFYLEVIEYDADEGYWRVTYGAEVTLNDDDLEVSTEHYTEAVLPSGTVFFRLWNGIELITNYPKVTSPTDPTALADGIRLEFDAASSGNYWPGDYWTFEVRAGGIYNPETLIDDEPPEGVRYHRVPLAILHWDSDSDVHFEESQIDDCRDVFRPLTNQGVCCTYTIGDGIVSFGDFNDIQEALRHLPAAGGKLCLLPGLHEANVLIEGKKHIAISGCDKHTRVVPSAATPTDPIFTVRDSEGITLEHMDIVTFEGEAIVLERKELGDLREIVVGNNRILAHVHAVRLSKGTGVVIHDNKIRMLDKDGGDVAIFVQGEDVLIERNDIAVVPAEVTPSPEDVPDETPDPTDECVELEELYGERRTIYFYAEFYYALDVGTTIPSSPFKALGGIQIGSGSERVDVLRNTINGGAGDGIMLGSRLDVGALTDQAAGLPEATPITFTLREKNLYGGVRYKNQWMKNTSFVLQAEDGTLKSVVTDSLGLFYLKGFKPGIYRAFYQEPGYAFKGIREIDQEEFGKFYEFEAEEVEQPELDLSNILDFTYNISIDENEISNMGLSGIGVPFVKLEDVLDTETLKIVVKSNPDLIFWLLLAKLTGVLGGFVVNLNIYRNHISRCLQRSNDAERLRMRSSRGLGGISLGLGENILIRENDIVNNGSDQNNPVCGVFCLFADQLEIRANRIISNGPMDVDETSDIQPGLWGGIFALAVALQSVADQQEVIVESSYAAVISENVVNQPIGRALTLLAFGPLSVDCNQFAVGHIGPAELDKLVGAVLVANLAGLQNFTKAEFGRMQVKASEMEEFPGVVAEEATTENVGEDMSELRLEDHPQAKAVVPGRFEELVGIAAPHPNLPSGVTLFNSNQARLASGGSTVISQLVFTMDDLGFDGNQSELLGTPSLASIAAGLAQTQLLQQVNTLLGATNLRASDNRLKETLDLESAIRRLSLLTISLFMNCTTFNQGNHCTIAVSLMESFLSSFKLRASMGNLVLLPIFEPCQSVELQIAQNPSLLIPLLIGLMLGRP